MRGQVNIWQLKIEAIHQCIKYTKEMHNLFIDDNQHQQQQLQQQQKHNANILYSVLRIHIYIY